MIPIRRLILTAVLIVGVLSGFVERGTVAYLTSSTPSAPNQFVAGTLVLSAGVVATDTLTVSSLVPGDSFTSQLVVTNTGSVDFRYAMTTTVSSGSSLATDLQLAVRTKTTNACTSLDGALVVTTGTLSLASFGDPTTGSHAGDRNLASGSSESLCFTVTLPTTVTTALQQQSTSVIFNLASEQLSGT